MKARAEPDLRPLRACLEGAVPGMVATCDAEGMPNVAYLSQVVYVDEMHVALSFQFFNKTRRNILVNPCATVLLTDPGTGLLHRLHLRYLRTEDSGPLFEGMRAQLAGIASHEGMADVFVLRGADIYRVEDIESLPGEGLSPAPARCDLLHALRRCCQDLAQCTALEDLVQALFAGMRAYMGVEHAMVLLPDAATGRLYTVASMGYAQSGVGSEVGLGQGVIGVAAQQRTAVRISHVTHASLYTHSIRRSMAADATPAGQDIPYPGLDAPGSQLAIPLLAAGRMLGVVFVESADEMRFGYQEEDALVALAGQLAVALDPLRTFAEHAEPAEPALASARPLTGSPVRVRHFSANDSVFLNDDYLIKGVAGAIFCKLLRETLATGRVDFSNRELRLDASLKLPDVADNLEARLLLLQRRLQENSPHIRLEKTGRGRLRLVLKRPVELDTVSR